MLSAWLTTAASSRREPARVLKQLLGAAASGDKIDEVLTALLADAAGQLANRQEPDGPTVREIVAGKVPEALQLVCRSERGLWAETLGEEVRRTDVLAFTPDWLINNCGKAMTRRGIVAAPSCVRH